MQIVQPRGEDELVIGTAQDLEKQCQLNSALKGTPQPPFPIPEDTGKVEEIEDHSRGGAWHAPPQRGQERRFRGDATHSENFRHTWGPMGVEGPHRRLSVCETQLHLRDVLGAQSQMGAQKGHENRVVSVILQDKG